MVILMVIDIPTSLKISQQTMLSVDPCSSEIPKIGQYT